MKKLMTLGLAAVMAFSLAACSSGSSSGKADGVYTAEMDDAAAEAAHGWRDTLTVEYKDGKVVSATFESYDADGNKKSETTAEIYPMDPHPSEWIPQLSENVQKAGTAKKIDTIAGATYASNDARALMEAIEKDGKAGETIQVSAAQ